MTDEKIVAMLLSVFLALGSFALLLCVAAIIVQARKLRRAAEPQKETAWDITALPGERPATVSRETCQFPREGGQPCGREVVAQGMGRCYLHGYTSSLICANCKGLTGWYGGGKPPPCERCGCDLLTGKPLPGLHKTNFGPVHGDRVDGSEKRSQDAAIRAFGKTVSECGSSVSELSESLARLADLFLLQSLVVRSIPPWPAANPDRSFRVHSVGASPPAEQKPAAETAQPEARPGSTRPAAPAPEAAKGSDLF